MSLHVGDIGICWTEFKWRGVIQFGQAIAHGPGDYPTHTFVVSDANNGIVREATARGIQYNPMADVYGDVLRDGRSWVEVFRLRGVSRASLRNALVSLDDEYPSGTPYGFLSYVGLWSKRLGTVCSADTSEYIRRATGLRELPRARPWRETWKPRGGRLHRVLESLEWGNPIETPHRVMMLARPPETVKERGVLPLLQKAGDLIWTGQQVGLSDNSVPLSPGLRSLWDSPRDAPSRSPKAAG